MSGAHEVASGKVSSDENFPVGSRLIRSALRPHVHAYYGWARAIDDIADNAVLSPEAKIARLGAMRAALLDGHENGGSASAATPEQPTASELAHARRLRASLARTGVDPATATDLVTAFEQDAVKPRYASWAELDEYCRYSACPVGRYLLALHGESPDSLPASDALCAALQVLNHLQDCAGDLDQLGRCYIPLPWLDAAGLDVGVLRAKQAPPALRGVFDRLLDEVDRLNAVATGLPSRVADRRMRLEAAVIVGLSLRLAARLRREDPLAGRVKLRKPDVAASLLGALRHWRRRRPAASRARLARVLP